MLPEEKENKSSGEEAADDAASDADSNAAEKRPAEDVKKSAGEDDADREEDGKDVKRAESPEKKRDEDAEEEKVAGTGKDASKESQDGDDPKSQTAKKDDAEALVSQLLKKPTAKQADNRGRRLLGSMMGHLVSARSRLKDEGLLDQRRRRQVAEDQSERIAKEKELVHLEKRLERHYTAMKNFIRTRAEPTIFYLPKKLSSRSEGNLEETRDAIEAKIKDLRVSLRAGTPFEGAPDAAAGQERVADAEAAPAEGAAAAAEGEARAPDVVEGGEEKEKEDGAGSPDEADGGKDKQEKGDDAAGETRKSASASRSKPRRSASGKRSRSGSRRSVPKESAEAAADGVKTNEEPEEKRQKKD